MESNIILLALFEIFTITDKTKKVQMLFIYQNCKPITVVKIYQTITKTKTYYETDIARHNQPTRTNHNHYTAKACPKCTPFV